MKFRLLGEDGLPIPDAEAEALDAWLAVFYEEQTADGTPVDPGDTVPDSGDTFRYDADDDLFIFNLGTKDSSWVADYTYGVAIVIDGRRVADVFFALR